MGDAAEYVPPLESTRQRGGLARPPSTGRARPQESARSHDPSRTCTPLNVRTVSSDDRGDYIVDNIIFDSRPGFPVTGNLYRPKRGAGPRPAILSPIGHLLHDGKRDTEVQARSIKLAKMGFIVLSYDAIGHGERMVAGNNHHEARLRPVTAWRTRHRLDGLGQHAGYRLTSRVALMSIPRASASPATQVVA